MPETDSLNVLNPLPLSRIARKNRQHTPAGVECRRGSHRPRIGQNNQVVDPFAVTTLRRRGAEPTPSKGEQRFWA